MKWTFLRYSIGASLLTYSISLFAFPLNFTNPQWFVSAGAGTQNTQFSGATSVNNNSGLATPYNRDIYTTRKYNRPFLLFSGGKRLIRHNDFLPAISLGLEYQYSLTSNIGGEVIQYSDPLFHNYTYHLSVNTNLLLATAKLNLFQLKKFSPYLNFGLGGVLNAVGSYSEGALPGVTPRESPSFRTQYNVQIAYELGAGIDYLLSEQLILTLGYLYQDLGQLQTDKGTGSWSGQKLNVGTLNANALFFSVTYLFT